MPITKSAKKSLKVTRTKRAQNYLRTVTLEKALRKASPETANEVMSIIDKTAKTGIIHKNKAARLKSQLAKKIAATPVEKKIVAKKTAVKAVKKTAKKK